MKWHLGFNNVVNKPTKKTKMKKIMLKISTLVLFSLIAASCGTNNDNKAEVIDETKAENMNDEKFETRDNEKIADWVVDSYTNSMMITQLSSNINGSLANAETKKIATEINGMHIKGNEEIKAFASSKSITLPEALTENQMKQTNELNDEKGLDADRKYLNKMIDWHEDEIKREENAIDKNVNAELSTWYTKNLTMLREHLQSLKMLKDKIK
jgi:putative membrane protein